MKPADNRSVHACESMFPHNQSRDAVGKSELPWMRRETLLMVLRWKVSQVLQHIHNLQKQTNKNEKSRQLHTHFFFYLLFFFCPRTQCIGLYN